MASVRAAQPLAQPLSGFLQQTAPSVLSIVNAGKGRLLDVQAEGIAVGGHRGMGENFWVAGRGVFPSYRENTLRSFERAAALGASFVEFDVQVTKDGVPIIWHDNSILYGNPASPVQCAIADLTLAEFEALGALSASNNSTQLSVVRTFKDAATDARMTAASRWKCANDDAFPTLEAALTRLPHHVAFDIEVKMATPDDLAVTPQEEIDRMVENILRVVNAAAGERTIMFSSFDPDVCKALRARQHRFPVMFLSTGHVPHADARRTSLSAALAVAADYSLSGVVVDTSVLRGAPETVALARMQGLKVLTYGLENNNPEWVRTQHLLGVHAAIVDDVQRVVQGLQQAAVLA